MACGATLKRSLEFDPLHGPSGRVAKRRRCMPVTMSPAVPPTKQHQLNPSPFAAVTPTITSDQIAAHLSAEIKRMQRRRRMTSTSMAHSPSPSSSGGSSPRSDDLSAALTAVQPQAGVSTSNTSMCSVSSGSLSAASTRRRDSMPLFSIKQVGLVCERMMREREEQIRDEYEKVMSCKLAEQYEAFLKFNHDQIHRRFGEIAASYVS